MINPEYARKLVVAARVVDDAYVAGGLDAVETEMASWRRLDADPVILAEMERLHRRHCLRVRA